MKWIDVKEQLPKKRIRVIGKDNIGYLGEIFYGHSNTTGWFEPLKMRYNIPNYDKETWRCSKTECELRNMPTHWHNLNELIRIQKMIDETKEDETV